MRGRRISRIGVSAGQWNPPPHSSSFFICGLVGSLSSELAPGSVFIPEIVADENGTSFQCNPRLVQTMQSSARSLGLKPHAGRMLTSSTIVTGTARAKWKDAGFDGVDMETAIVARSGVAFVSVRVVLDSPDRPISSEWLQSRTAMLKPQLWPELIWMTIFAPTYAVRAAQVVARGLTELDS